VKYYIIAGEASGDLHASNLMKELKRLDVQADFRCWGGDKMQNEGAELVRHYKELAFMGFTEVIMNLRTILRNIAFCKEDILKYNPDVVILVDYPGFNLRIAEFAKQHGIKVFYYISPQIWAWKQSRVIKIKKYVDQMFVILPFEKQFYEKFNYNVDFVGHPLLDAISSIGKTNESFIRRNKLTDKAIIALLPGSRKQEIYIMLPHMTSVINDFPDHQFVIAAAPSLPTDYYKSMIRNANIKIVTNQTYELLSHCTAAIVTSGTATLETALFEVPQVVCYKAGWISYHIARTLVKVNFISLVNLIMEKEVVKELIQQDLKKENLVRELRKITFDKKALNTMKKDYIELKQKLGGAGASSKTAKLMINYLTNNKL
jgi:lipid-A-disaccharide synthase